VGIARSNLLKRCRRCGFEGFEVWLEPLDPEAEAVELRCPRCGSKGIYIPKEWYRRWRRGRGGGRGGA